MQVGARTPRSSATRIFIAPSHLCFAAVRSSAPPPSLRAPPGARTSLLDHLGETPPEPAPDAPDPAGPSPHRGTLRARRVDLVEHPAVGEVGRLRLLPSAKHAVDGDELELRELRGVFRRDLRVARPVEVLRRELLPLRPVQELEVRLRDRLRAVPRDVLPYDRHRRLGQDGRPRDDDLELSLPELLDREERLVLPGEEDVAEAALDERRGRPAGPRVE